MYKYTRSHFNQSSRFSLYTISYDGGFFLFFTITYKADKLRPRTTPDEKIITGRIHFLWLGAGVFFRKCVFPVGVSVVGSVENTFNWIKDAELESSLAQIHWHLYFPSSSSVTLAMVRMKSVLHLLLVLLFCISYFSPLVNGVELLLKNHWNFIEFAQSSGSISTKHFKLTLL